MKRCIEICYSSDKIASRSCFYQPVICAGLPSSGSPSDPYLELEGRKLLHQATVTVREPQKLSLHCVVSGAIPPVRRIHWSIGKSTMLECLLFQ